MKLSPHMILSAIILTMWPLTSLLVLPQVHSFLYSSFCDNKSTIERTTNLDMKKDVKSKVTSNMMDQRSSINHMLSSATFVSFFIASSQSADAAVDCMTNCLKNCKIVAPKMITQPWPFTKMIKFCLCSVELWTILFIQLNHTIQITFSKDPVYCNENCKDCCD